MITRAEHMSGKATHDEYYLQMVDDAIIQHVCRVVGVAKIKASTDPHFNDIPLGLWDRTMAGVGGIDWPQGDCRSLAGLVCIAKAAAKKIKADDAFDERIPNKKRFIASGVDAGYGEKVSIKAFAQYDDACGNGHRTFSITADIYGAESRREIAGGCCHDEIAEHFSNLAPLIKWHLCSTDGPMHYIANTVYHAKSGDINAARRSAIWPDATLEQLRSKAALEARLPALLEEFKAAVESLGFTY